ncbi:hypothetical protein PF005_g2821 [Phytophthora fragariae]|uniref:Ubiquitin-like protease family profile domain-containing protein n=2 Tax=Phytophthora TaxID=4783 RepID=A0A6A3Z838_9STRA|nr:hypothetical protein PF003_g4836 [Phytophthora fragariae]KAE9356302.1 hypothetical protein PR003_g2388 [Phytophthora rubi]KAE8947262.1 hypothetical protein PF009_g3118 [Phytophthora fragariae]KAE9007745.1 hypothetical protein PF011_g10999 [Phytophthora fragariae]KAE9134261.1 hypothetical protein PF010_g2534 [Phytophthora fragariae]
MEPQQRINYDCGIYMLYCMDIIAHYIVDKSPLTLLDEIKKLTGSCTASKAEKFRAALRDKMQELVE